MNKTLRLSFSLKNTYRVNSILYSLKQIPLIKKLLPDMLYRVHAFKIFANILSVLWEIVSVFLGKAIYYAVMLYGFGSLYKAEQPQGLYLHILLFLTVIGALLNTYMFDPSRDKYYAMVLLRMDARQYTLVNYWYAILKVVIGFLPAAVIFGLLEGIPVWICLLIPFFVAGLKLVSAAVSLTVFEKTGRPTNENGPGKLVWLSIILLMGAAYGLPAIGLILPETAVVALMVLSIAGGIAAVWKILSFRSYREMYQQLFAKSMHQMDNAKKLAREQSRRAISADTAVTSRRKGFEFLNELFIRRHQKILWKASRKIAVVCLCIVLGALLAFYLAPEYKEPVNGLLLTYLPYFVFIMYAINRGAGFTQALFMNCDHSLLTYSFYKQPRFVLRLFQIRLREIIKVNLLPAAVIGAGLSVLLYASGGTDNPLNYAVLFISILCLSVFFSTHYLTIYYLLQPYNAGTEMKSGTYQIAHSVTYFVCFFMMQLKMPTIMFGLMTIIFCVVYCAAACVLIYRLAPKTFRIRA